ncbi:MAG: methylenetetrahydrofolate reductase [Nocardioides sp.]|jgi:methylenetetrahydrofolate reductase (NADPH)
MRNTQRGSQSTMEQMLTHARYEVLPTARIVEQVVQGVPKDVQITVTASAAKGLELTLTTAETLRAEGYDVVPHLAARMVHGKSELAEIVARLTGIGVHAVFVPGGDAEADETYPDALALLEDLAAMGQPFDQVGIAGYPESHPTIHDDVTIQSMWDKRKYATHVVSNLTFDPAIIKRWVHRMRERGITMPLLIGMPGPIDRAKLLSMATKIGVGESTKFLVKQKGVMARLTAPGGFTGERFLTKCLPTISEPGSLIEGLHIYTFNQVAETEAWRQRLLGEHAGV